MSAGGAILVVGSGGLHSEDDIPDQAYERDKVDEHPPSALADVVHTADADGEAGDDVGKGEDAVEDHACLAKAQKDYVADEHVEAGIPVLSAGGATVEVGILLVETRDCFSECDVHNGVFIN